MDSQQLQALEVCVNTICENHVGESLDDIVKVFKEAWEKIDKNKLVNRELVKHRNACSQFGKHIITAETEISGLKEKLTRRERALVKIKKTRDNLNVTIDQLVILSHKKTTEYTIQDIPKQPTYIED